MSIARFAHTMVILLCSTAFAQSNPAPFINEPLNPASAVPGGKGFELVVTGTGFASGATLSWNGVPKATIVNSASSLQALISPNDIARRGTASVTVTNPAPGGGTSNTVYFPIRRAASAIGFAPDRAINESGSVIVADFNNDGKLDVAVGTFSGGITVYLGLGNGKSSAGIVTTTTTSTARMIVADFDNDGKIDVAVGPVLGDQDFVTGDILYGKGNGMFTTGPFLSGTPEAAGDWNNDGILDLALGESDENGHQWTSIYIGKGGGIYVETTQEIGGAGTAAIGDFNGDGLVDLAFAQGSFVSVALNSRGGFFSDDGCCVTVFSQKNVVAADVNRDGKLDLISDGISVLLGNGDGTFTETGDIDLFGDGIGINVGDFNGDGLLDIVVATQTAGIGFSQSIKVFLGNGDGTFQSPTEFAAGNVDSSFTGFGMGDFNKDGALDLILKGDGISLLLQNPVTLTPTGFAFGDQDVGTTSSPQIATLTNVGSGPLTIQNISINPNNEFAQTNNCGSTLAAGASCSISVTFSPKLGGDTSAVMHVGYVGVGSPLSMTMTGTGVNAATARLTPTSLQFPVQFVGTISPAQTATLSNTGTVTVNISNISITGPFTQTNNCPAKLTSFAECQIHVQFAPLVAGSQTGHLKVIDDAVNSPQTATLTGTATEVRLSATGLNFGNQKVGTTSPALPVTLTNIGQTVLTIQSVGITGLDAGDFAQSNNCGAQVLPGQSCQINVTFTPTAQGSRAASLAITDNGGASPQSLGLSGTGT